MNYREGTFYEGFSLKKKEFINEIDSEAFLFIHEKTGAKLIAVKNKDLNKTFAITFKTVTDNSTGVPHILEHSVLSGSRKYPLKDVFSEVAKGGLNTFLNAFTAMDFTIYPFSTRNEKEYFNIMDIYLDSVFNPLLTRNTFLREGWHYDINDRNDTLKLNGIVYNEMKGAYSDPYELLNEDILKALMPGSSYAFNTGGNPIEIPDLTYEAFVEYHQRHYHPSNSIIYVYGDADLRKELSSLDHYLSEFDKNDSSIEIITGNIIKKPVHLEDSYSIDPDASDKERTFIEIGHLISKTTDLYKNLSFSLLSNLLHASNASPLKEAVIKAKICNDFSGHFESRLYYTVFLTVISGSEKENRDRFLEIYYDTLKTISRNGFERDFILSKLNRFEFALRQKNSMSLRGLEYGTLLSGACIYNAENIFDYLKITPLLERLKKDTLENRLLETLINEYLINNPRTAVLTMVPDRHKADRINTALEEKLQRIKGRLSENQLEECIIQANNLKQESTKTNTDDELKIIPKLSNDDIDKEIQWVTVVEDSVSNIPILATHIYTNGIIYVELGFGTDSLTLEELNMLELFGDILTQLGTKNKTHEQLSILKSEYTGIVTSYFDVYSNIATQSNIKPYFWLKFSTTPAFLENSLDLISDIMLNTSFEDEKRIKDIIDRQFIRKEQDISSEGEEIAYLRLKAYLGEMGRYTESVYGYSAFKYLKEIRKNYNKRKKDIRSSFIRICEKLFNRDNLLINVISEEENNRLFVERSGILLDSLHSNKYEPAKRIFPEYSKDEAFLTPAEVVFAYAGGNIYKAGIKYNGSIEVLKKYIGRDYLYKHIRLLGGAYGSRINIDPITGDMILGSYRDPNIIKTYKAFDNIPDDLKNFKMGRDSFLQLIIGAYSGFDPLLNPDTKGVLARNEYLNGITTAFKQKIVNEILSTTPGDLVSIAPYIAHALKDSRRSIIGSSSKIMENRKMFDCLITI